MDTTIKRTAHELTIMFQDGSDIPSRLKKGGTAGKIRPSSDSDVERRYEKHTAAWANTIETILKHNSDQTQAWRFIRITPSIDNSSINSVTRCKDFLDFNNLLAKRRDIDNCDNDELGKLSMLLTAFQQEIEKSISRERS